MMRGNGFGGGGVRGFQRPSTTIARGETGSREQRNFLSEAVKIESEGAGAFSSRR